MINSLKKIVAILLVSMNLNAFSTTNVQYLYGSFDGSSFIDTENGGKSTLTLEHYSTNPIGDIYGFADYSIADDRFKGSDKKSELYFEIAPRLSMSKLNAKDLSFGIFKDWYLSGQYNRQVHEFKDYRAYLYGVGTDLDLATFDVFGVNLYKKDQNIGKNTYQMTLNYNTKDILGTKFMFNGFADFTEYDTLTQNQLVYKLSSIEALGDANVYLGTEWVYFKIKDSDNVSNTLQLLLQLIW